MKRNSKDALARWVEDVAKRLSEDSDANLSRAKSDDKIYLVGVGNKYTADLRRLSDTLLETGGWEHKLSGDYVEQRVLGILLELVDHPTGSNALPLLERLWESLDSYDERRTVYLAVSGVKMTDVEELRFGQVALKKMTEVQTTEIVESLGTGESKERFSDRVRSVPFAEMTVSAEPIKAWEIAVDRLRDVLDMLRYSMPFLSNEDLDPDINLMGQNRSSPPLVAVHRGEAEDLGSFRDLPTSLEISSGAVEKMRDAGFFEAAAFAGKEEKTQLERKVLRGIQWASDSQSQREHDNKLLSLIIALECLLPSNKPSGSGIWTSEGTALLLGSDMKTRRAIRNKILGFYKKRNNIRTRAKWRTVIRSSVRWTKTTATTSAITAAGEAARSVRSVVRGATMPARVTVTSPSQAPHPDAPIKTTASVNALMSASYRPRRKSQRRSGSTQVMVKLPCLLISLLPCAPGPRM